MRPGAAKGIEVMKLTSVLVVNRAKAQLAAKQVGGKSTLKSNVKALSILCPKVHPPLLGSLTPMLTTSWLQCFCSMLDYSQSSAPAAPLPLELGPARLTLLPLSFRAESFSVHFLAKHPKDIIPTKESFGAAAEKSGQL